MKPPAPVTSTRPDIELNSSWGRRALVHGRVVAVVVTFAPAPQAGDDEPCRALRQMTEGICNSAQALEAKWLAFDAELAEGGAYEAAMAAHNEAMAKTPGTAEAIAGLRAALAQAVQIAQAMQTADPTIFPGLQMPDAQ